jgi:succinate-semialdehyde dehydrogenase/glutarate-semialdehyde dehydrogenase
VRNLKLILSYDGSDFFGWQVQPGRTTVQGALASAIARLSGEHVLPQGSGRTDAGVHALAQVASFRTASPIPAENWARALNDILPPSIRVLEVTEAASGFHARKSARAKTYRYRMYRAAICPPFLARYVWHYPYPLQEPAMIAAAGVVVGEHDFTSFAAVDPERLERFSAGATCGAGTANAGTTNVRTIFSSTWARAGDELIYTVRGSGFLHHMVRNLIGTFLLMGKGTVSLEDLRRIRGRPHRARQRPLSDRSGILIGNGGAPVPPRVHFFAMATDAEFAVSRIASVNPATGEILGELDSAGPAEVRATVARARAAQPDWNAWGIRHRVRVVRRFQQLLLARKAGIARRITLEAGKPMVEALLTEVLVALDAARFLADNAFAILREEKLPHRNLALKAKSGRILREPYGVVGIISPWNYPFSIPATGALAALVAGNAVVLKPSELTPLIALKLQSLLGEAGVPRGIFQVLPGAGPTGEALVKSEIDKLVFTGSVATGRRIARLAAERLLPVLLELGGKDAMLVLEDADIDVASSAAVWGAFMNAGQTCLSVQRCYAHRSLYPAFLAACADKARKLRVGNGMSEATDVGPMIHERQVRLVESQVEDALQRGARVLAGGVRLRELGPTFFAPTVLADVDHTMRVMREETFGPVLPIAPFADDAEAVRLANDSEYGLAASVWTGDRARGERLARRIDAGTVMVNDVLSSFSIAEAPHGGVKSSGLGRTHGRWGLEEMARLKYLDSDRLPRLKKIWWFGYGGGFTREMDGFLDLLYARPLREKLKAAVRAAGALWRRKL